VTRVGYDHHIRVWHDVIEFESSLARTDDIVATVDDGGWDVVQFLGAVQEIILVGQERLIDEVMRFDPSNGERGFPVFWYGIVPISLIGDELRDRGFPDVPFPSRFEAGDLIVAGKVLVITFNRS